MAKEVIAKFYSVLPITPNLCLRIAYKPKFLFLKNEDFLKNIDYYLHLPLHGRIDFVEYRKAEVNNINRLVIKCAENLVFSSEKSPIMSELARKYSRYRINIDCIEISGKEDEIYQGTILRVRET